MYKFKIVLLVLFLMWFFWDRSQTEKRQEVTEFINEVKPLLDNPEYYLNTIKEKGERN